MIANILKDFETELISVDFHMINLETFNLKDFESLIYNRITNLFNDIMQRLLECFCNSGFFKAAAYNQGKTTSVKKIKKRSFPLKLRTGKYINLEGFYADKVTDSHKGDRHLFHSLFDTIASSSPNYASHVSKIAVASPSFDIAQDLLNEVGISAKTSQIRTTTIKLGQTCLADRVALQLENNETLAGKSVIVSIDGGRTRTRKYTDQQNKKETHYLYDTPWIEPKLLVIHVLDPLTGKQSKKELPIYDCTFSDVECFELTKAYLKRLQVEKAANVQFIADGAQWIWNRAKEMLLSLNVKPENITETLDYYHAVEHLGVLIENLPRTVKKEERPNLYSELKNKLWNGDIDGILSRVKELTRPRNKDLIRELNYFTKHKNRCNYSQLKGRKLLTGSGIVESGVRRVINLRFKCPSAFWNKENLEPLIYLRSVFLAKRWDIVLENLG